VGGEGGKGGIDESNSPLPSALFSIRTGVEGDEGGVGGALSPRIVPLFSKMFPS